MQIRTFRRCSETARSIGGIGRKNRVGSRIVMTNSPIAPPRGMPEREQSCDRGPSEQSERAMRGRPMSLDGNEPAQLRVLAPHVTAAQHARESKRQ
jgi:hypothetical protein